MHSGTCLPENKKKNNEISMYIFQIEQDGSLENERSNRKKNKKNKKSQLGPATKEDLHSLLAEPTSILRNL